MITKSRLLLAFACCLVLILAPLSVAAQTPGGVIKKGAEGVQKGVEGAAKGTEEGAEAVGKGVKKAVTGEDTTTSQERMKGTEPAPSTTPSQKTPSGTTSKSTEPERTATEKKLPRTAGELPLLVLTGVLALAAAGVSRVARRVR